jgi:superfamily II DNA helicase RecQ
MNIFLFVLCPFKSVLIEWEAKCASLDNRNFCYRLSNHKESNVVPGSCKLILASCDSLDFESTRALLQIYGSRIARFVVDEAHVILQDSRSYRLRLTKVGELQEFLPRPYLLLSGTYSKQLEAESADFYRVDKFVTFRNRTDRQNLQISLVEIESLEKGLNVVIKGLNIFAESIREDPLKRCMVFVRTKRQAEEWSELCGDLFSNLTTGGSVYWIKGSIYLFRFLNWRF